MEEKTKENTTFVISETAKPNSFEVGKASSRFKIYYKDTPELKSHILELVALDLMDIETLNQLKGGQS